MKKILRDTTYLHPRLAKAVRQIETELIQRHMLPFRLFETGRFVVRQKLLVDRGLDNSMASAHLIMPGVIEQSAAVDFVYFDNAWSWNLRNQTVLRWYQLFGELVVNVCPDLWWSGHSRTYIDYTHFELKREIYNWRKVQADKRLLPSMV